MKTKKIKSVVLLTRQQTKDFLQVSAPTLRKWTKNGLITAYSLGGRIYYKQHELVNALQVVESTD